VDAKIRRLIRNYVLDSTDENAHRLANAIARAGGLPSEEDKRFGFFEFCSDCDEPTSTFEICSYIGYNPGVDGHLFKNTEDANSAWESFIVALSSDRTQGIVRGEYWTELPFDTLQEELDYLENKVRLIEIHITKSSD